MGEREREEAHGSEGRGRAPTYWSILGGTPPHIYRCPGGDRHEGGALPRADANEGVVLLGLCLLACPQDPFWCAPYRAHVGISPWASPLGPSKMFRNIPDPSGSFQAFRATLDLIRTLLAPLGTLYGSLGTLMVPNFLFF